MYFICSDEMFKDTVFFSAARHWTLKFKSFCVFSCVEGFDYIEYSQYTPPLFLNSRKHLQVIAKFI